MDSKALSSVEIKDADKGHVTAVFSTYDVVDKDGDITVKGAIKDGTPVIISDWNHSSWQGARPIGKGVVRDVGNQAVVEAEFFMNTTAGRDAFETIKQLGGRQQWSYGFDVTESETPDEEAKSAGARRILKAMDVHEVSPVMIGAGVNTRTVGVKSKKFSEHGAEVLASVKEFRARTAEVKAMRAEKGGDLGAESKALVEELTSELEALKADFATEPVKEEISDSQREWLRSLASNL